MAERKQRQKSRENGEKSSERRELNGKKTLSLTGTILCLGNEGMPCNAKMGFCQHFWFCLQYYDEIENQHIGMRS